MEKIDVALRADEPLRAGLMRVADNLVKNAVERIRKPTSVGVEDLHFVRVTIKRLSAILVLIRPAIKKKAFDRGNVRLRTANRRVSFARDADLARQTLATLPFTKKREMDSAASALGGFRRSGAPEADMSKTMKVTAMDLDQTRRNLHRPQISRDEWKAIEPGLRKVYRQTSQSFVRELGQHWNNCRKYCKYEKYEASRSSGVRRKAATAHRDGPLADNSCGR